MRLPVIIGLLLAAPACGGPEEPDALEQLDRELAAVNAADPARDPALNAALQSQILVDPNLQQQSNANAIRPPNRPDAGAVPPVDIAARPEAQPPAGLKSAPAPKADCPECRARSGALTLGALAERQRHARTAACAPTLAYSYAWANRLPAATPLYPDARVVEAAGTDAAGCSLRIVTFRSSAPLGRVVDWYHTKGGVAGFAPEHRADGGLHVVGGARGEGAFLAYLRERNGGTEVDLVVNGG